MKLALKRIILIALLFSTSASYLLFSVLRGPRPLVFGQTSELYGLLADSFLHGHTSLPLQPSPKLLALPDPYDPVANQDVRLHDASLYNGRYYLYFGPVPAAVLFAPFRLLTGASLPNRYAVPLFCIVGYLSSCALFFLVVNYVGWALPFWLECSMMLSLGSMSLVSLLIRRPSVYEVAIAAGYCFLMTAFWLLAKGLLGPTHKTRWLALSGLCFALTIGCRPHLFVISVIVFGALLFARLDRRSLTALLVPMAAFGLVLAAYNYARFGNPAEFGRSYQLTGFSDSTLQRNISTVAQGASTFLFLGPRIDASFPYVHTVFTNPLVGWNGPSLWTEDMVGLLPAAPFCLLGLFAPLFLGRRFGLKTAMDPAADLLLKVIYWSGMAVFLILCGVGWILGRYLVDFGPLITMLGACIIVALWQRLSARPGLTSRAFRSAAIGIAAYAVFFNLAIMTPRSDLIQKFLSRTGKPPLHSQLLSAH